MFGQLGDGTRVSRFAPLEVGGIEGAEGLAAGTTHACARVAGGRLRCWGSNAHRELGVGPPKQSAKPLAVPLGPAEGR